MSNTTITPTVGAAALAGVAPTFTQLVGFTALNALNFSGLGYLATWTGLTTALGTGIPETFAAWERCFTQVSGTIGAGGSIQLEGSNDGVNWIKLSPAAITASLPAFFAPLAANENPVYIRPHVTAGDGTTLLTVTAWFEL
jgi:hypothetical protein